MLKLVRLSEEYKEQLIEMIDEWALYNKEHPEADKSPGAIFKNDVNDFENYLINLNPEVLPEGLVPATTFFCLDEERNIFVGAVDIRHYLNDYLLQFGGHIGDGVRPSERRKGIATKMIELALYECKKMGIQKVLMTCHKDNIGSAKSIQNNGGVLENEIMENGKPLQRYWIELE